MAWLSSVTNSSHHYLTLLRHDKHSPPPPTLGILAFETAKTMSRLISLYKSLSLDQFLKLRTGAMKSQGVAFLNSKDECFLLSLACAEKLQDLNRAASTVSRFCTKCSNFKQINHFHVVYTDAIKLGIIDLTKPEFNSKHADKIIQKMEKYVTATLNLHAALEFVTEMEISERKLQKWKRNTNPKHGTKPNIDYFQDKIAYQRKQVKRYRRTSLWSQSFDEIVGLMSRIICIIYARICTMFGPFVSTLPRVTKHVRSPSTSSHKVHQETNYCLIKDKHRYIKQRAFKSGPIMRITKKTDKTRFYSSEFFPSEKRVTQQRWAPESTVGAAGLTMRYANIILLAEQHLHAPMSINEEARGVLYEMLTATLKEKVRGKMRRRWGGEEVKNVGRRDGHSLAEGWREALEGLMTWLAPMAHDTVTWVTERNLEKQRFDAKPTVLLCQTLYYSDLDKTEAAIVELLVGLSCVCRYENRRFGVDRCT
ncbi:DUF668 domain-containing protein/DUF3475 domain-containing protein [Cephalotus follicularis]|uniref:DUF668 domain-containing protein/DUF3475 domain-containing protein n=1 Tax=Cephalotus follicularis TaxID=3775 RepID=A0A1Q3C916_CEPFO|nr:DUF668 domain-containing protein/DUF3475 domain-containing protein [Cephalotus follicularis]